MGCGKAKARRIQMTLCHDDGTALLCAPVKVTTECKVKFVREHCYCSKAVRLWIGSIYWQLTDKHNIHYYACKNCASWLDSQAKELLEKRTG